jgi:hypothetical protein
MTSHFNLIVERNRIALRRASTVAVARLRRAHTKLIPSCLWVGPTEQGRRWWEGSIECCAFTGTAMARHWQSWLAPWPPRPAAGPDSKGIRFVSLSGSPHLTVLSRNNYCGTKKLELFATCNSFFFEGFNFFYNISIFRDKTKSGDLVDMTFPPRLFLSRDSSNTYPSNDISYVYRWQSI